MFPTPIAQASKPVQWLYRTALPLSLVIWLLPLIAIALTPHAPISPPIHS
ncbi:hypothetical protein [Paraburkholderia sediminicola]